MTDTGTPINKDATSSNKDAPTLKKDTPTSNKDTSNADKEDDVLECAICLNPCMQPVQLPCSHVFCFLCAKVSDFLQYKLFKWEFIVDFLHRQGSNFYRKYLTCISEHLILPLFLIIKKITASKFFILLDRAPDK